MNSTVSIQPGVNPEAHFSFRVPDIRCASCALCIESKLLKEPGVTKCRTHLPTQRVIVDGSVARERLENCIRTLGFTPAEWDEGEVLREKSAEKRDMLSRLGVAGIGMMQVMMYALATYLAGSEGLEPVFQKLMQWSAFVVAVPVALYSALPFYRNAWRDIRAGSTGMDVPVSIAILSAFLLSAFNLVVGRGDVYFDSVCMFTFLLLLGRYLEMGARHQYQTSLDISASCLPVTALRDTDGEPVLLKTIVRGDRFRVASGCPVPADGRVIEGRAQVSEAAFTGESMPVNKEPGSRVLAGSENLEGDLVIEADTDFSDFVINKMNASYQEARLYKPVFAILADRLSRYFVATILGLAVLSGLFWAMAGSPDWFAIAITVLVVSCPCALSLATPVAYTIALTVLRRQGVIVSKGCFLEKLAETDTLVFDKTGTLTTGNPVITRIQLLSNRMSEEEVLELCAALEAGSRHPLARAFQRPYQMTVSNNEVLPGEGVSGEINGQTFRLGKPAFACPGYSGAIDDADSTGMTVMLADDEPLALVSLHDSLRPDVPALLGILSMSHDCCLLSGDRKAEVERTGQAAGIRILGSEVSPAAKLEFIVSMQRDGKKVMMIGDGINDAAAMAAAHTSLAVSPVDVVVQEAAEATFVRQDLAALSGLIDYAQRARRIIRQNIAWAIGYNMLAIPLAVTGVLAPWMAALGMSASSLLVVGNASRLRKAPAGLGMKGEES